MKILSYIFLGGGLGSVARYVFSKYANGLFVAFPLGTLISNLLACFFVGVLSGIALRNNPDSILIKYLLIVGFCGGFSTFSTLIFESVHLFKDQFQLQSILYMFMSIVLGILFLYIGLIVSK